MKYRVLKVLIAIGIIGTIVCGIKLANTAEDISTYNALIGTSHGQKYYLKLENAQKAQKLEIGIMIASFVLSCSCVYIHGRVEKTDSIKKFNLYAPLMELEKLKGEGLISNEEYQIERKNIINSLHQTYKQ